MKLRQVFILWGLVLIVGCQHKPPTTKPVSSQKKKSVVHRPKESKSMWCAGDLFEYVTPKQIEGYSIELEYDFQNKIQITFYDYLDQLYDQVNFKVTQKEELKTSQVHANQTVLASTTSSFRLPLFKGVEKLVWRRPLTEKGWATLDFQKGSGSFIGGNQQLECEMP